MCGWEKEHALSISELPLTELWQEMSTEERKKTTPRTIMFGGKAFATYTNAKRIVKLVNDVGTVVNTDPEVNSYLKVCCFLHLIFLKISFYRLQTLKYIFSSRKTRQLHC